MHNTKHGHHLGIFLGGRGQIVKKVHCLTHVFFLWRGLIDTKHQERHCPFKFFLGGGGLSIWHLYYMSITIKCILQFIINLIFTWYTFWYPSMNTYYVMNLHFLKSSQLMLKISQKIKKSFDKYFKKYICRQIINIYYIHMV